VQLGYGQVGGYLVQSRSVGAIAGSQALKILDGVSPSQIPLVTVPNAFVFDWRALQRWGISQRDLPPDSTILNRPLTAWELYKRYILGALSLILLEALLIFGLVINRARAQKAEAELRHNQRRLADLIETAFDAIVAVDEGQRIVLFNSAAERIFDCPAASAIGEPFDRFVPQRLRAAHNADIFRFGETGTTSRVMGAMDTLSGLRSTGEEFPIEASISQVETSGKKLYTVIIRDISKRKQAEAELRRLNRALQTLSRCNQSLTHSANEQQLVESICQSLVETGGYRMAWVGYAEQDGERRVRPVASAGFDDGYLANIDITWGEGPSGQGAPGCAIREGHPVVNRNTATNPAYAPWRTEALKRGYLSSITLPLYVANQAMGALTLHASEPEAFDEQELRLLRELADDLSFGIDTIRTRDQRKRAEAELHLTLFSLEHASDGMFRMDPMGRIVFVNESACQSLNRSREELLSLSISDVDPNVSPEGWSAMWERLKKRGSGTFETHHRTKDGRTFPVEVTSAYVEFDGKEYAFASVRDVTERVRAEEELRKEKAFTEAVIDSFPDIFFVLRGPGQFVHWGRNPERILGYSREETLALSQATEIVAEEYRPLAAQAIQSGFANGIVAVEVQLLHRDGRKIPYLLSATRAIIGGETLLVGIGLDITERKQIEQALSQSEERFRTVFETSGAGIVLLDLTGYLMETNAAFQHMLGYSGSELHHMRFTEVTHPDDREGDWRRFQELSEGKISKYEAEKRYIHKDGEIIWARLIVSLVRDTHGQPQYAAAMVSDITERKRAEEALQESEARFRMLIEEAPSGVRISRDGIGLYANKAFLQMFGLHQAREVVGQPIANVWAPESRFIVEERVRLWSDGEEISPSFDGIGIRKDGSKLDVHVDLVLVDLSDGRASLGFHSDVTETKRAQKRIMESEEKFRTVFMAGPDLVFMASLADGRVLEINDRCWDFFGYTRDEMIGKTATELGIFANPADRQKLVAEVKSKGGVRNLELDCKRKNGSVMRALVSVERLEISDEPVMVGVTRDITEQKRAEETMVRLRQAVDSSGEVVFMTDREGVITFINPEFTRLYGYAPEEVVGKATRRILKSDDVTESEYDRVWLAAEDKQFTFGEIVNQTKDGRKVMVERSANAVLDDRGDIVGFISIQTDITERKHLEQQLIQAQKMEAVGSLAAGVAHDFNNLLTIINGFSALLLKRIPVDDPMHSPLSEIRDAGERGAGLTRQLLAFSRKAIHALVILDLNDVINNASNMLRRLIGEDVKLVLLCQSGISMIKADAGQMEQILLNLAVNARDAMPRGGTLTIETSNLQADENYVREHHLMAPGLYVRLSVRDTGVGIEEKTQARIFEPFFTTKEIGKGTGLGLATVYAIAEQAGGHIEVESKIGHGATFTIYLPQASGTPQLKRTEEGIDNGTETILLVEDEEELRHMVRYILESCGYTVLEASSAMEAILIPAQHQGAIQLLLTDVVMPELSGRELAEKLTKVRPEIRVLYMSGYTDDTVLRYGVLESAVHFLQKPFSPTALSRKVREVLDA